MKVKRLLFNFPQCVSIIDKQTSMRFVYTFVYGLSQNIVAIFGAFVIPM